MYRHVRRMQSKLCRLMLCIYFLSLTLDPKQLLQVNKIEGLIRNWSSVLGKEARRQNRNRIEDISNQAVNLGGVEAFIGCPQLQQISRDLVSKAECKKEVSSKNLREITVWLAGSLLLSNHQRPGTIVNATLAEFRAAMTTTLGQTYYRILVVTNHKNKHNWSCKADSRQYLVWFLGQFCQPSLAPIA